MKKTKHGASVSENDTDLKKRNKKAKFCPAPAAVDKTDMQNYTPQEIAEATQLVEQEEKIEEEIKMSVLQKLSLLWTFISTGYMIVATVVFIAKDWIESTLSYVLICMLAVYIVVFIVLIVCAIEDARSVKKKLKFFKKLLGIFKVFANIVLLVLAATTMVGLAEKSGEPKQVIEWIMFGVTLFVAVIQFSLKAASLAMRVAAHGVAKRYKVKVERFKDGQRQKKHISDRIEEKKYK